MESKINKEDIKTIAEDISAAAEVLAGKTLLITGGAGFLGKYFIAVIDYLNNNVFDTPCKVISADNFITGVGYWTEPGPNFKCIKHDVKEPLEIDGPVDYIIHAAGIASPKFYREHKLETIEVATLGTWNMLKLAHEKKSASMLSFSSSEIYGDPDPKFIPTPETYWGNVSPIGPRSNYDESKRLGESLCITYFETYGVKVKIVRPFNVYGPGMRLDDYRVVPNFVGQGFRGEPLTVYGDGKNTRTYCYITDAIVGFFKVLLSEKSGEVYNVGNDDREIMVGNLAKLVADQIGPDTEIIFVGGINDAYQKDDPQRRCPDLTKIKTHLGYQPKVDLQTGIGRFLRWVIETHPKKVSVKGS